MKCEKCETTYKQTVINPLGTFLYCPNYCNKYCFKIEKCKHEKCRFAVSAWGYARKYCADCGEVFGNTLSVEKLYANKVTLDPDLELIDIVKNNTKFHDQLISVQERYMKKAVEVHEEKETKWFKDYKEYLNSPEWEKKRTLVLERDKYTCQGCLQNKAVQVHHLTYENAFDELLFQLISLCKPCHDKIHNDTEHSNFV